MYLDVTLDVSQRGTSFATQYVAARSSPGKNFRSCKAYEQIGRIRVLQLIGCKGQMQERFLIEIIRRCPKDAQPVLLAGERLSERSASQR